MHTVRTPQMTHELNNNIHLRLANIGLLGTTRNIIPFHKPCYLDIIPKAWVRCFRHGHSQRWTNRPAHDTKYLFIQ